MSLKFSLICLLTAFSASIFAQQKPEKVIWGEKLKNTNDLSAFIYKEGNLFTVNNKLKAIQRFSPTALVLEKTLSLEGKSVRIEGKSFDLFESVRSLIEYKDGLGLFLECTNKTDDKKFFGFFVLNTNLDEPAEFEAVPLFDIELDEKEAYSNSRIVKATENYVAIFSYNSSYIDDRAISRLDIISNAGVDYTQKYSRHKDDKVNGSRFVFADEAFLIQEWSSEGSNSKLVDGATGLVIADFSTTEYLDAENRVLAIEKMANGEFVMAGFYGKFEGGKNEMHGLFRLTTNGKGELIQDKSDKFKISDISTTQETSSVDDILITKAGDLYFVMSSNTGERMTISGGATTDSEQLMVIGIHEDEIWSKSIPFRQGYGSMIYEGHLGTHIMERDGHLILSYNDHRKNGENFDYNNFVYSKDNRPDKYICSLPDVITILDIDNSGTIEPYFINAYDIFVNLTETILLDDNSIFISGGAATVMGPGKSRFGRVILK